MSLSRIFSFLQSTSEVTQIFSRTYYCRTYHQSRGRPIPWEESVQLDERFSLSFSPLTSLLKRSQSQNKAFLHKKDAFVLAHILVQIPPTEFQNLHPGHPVHVLIRWRQMLRISWRNPSDVL